MKKLHKLILTSAAAAGIIAALCFAGSTALAGETQFRPLVLIYEKIGLDKVLQKPEPAPVPSASAAAEDGTFAFKLNDLMPRDKNYMVSPLSIRTALALAANGSDNETREELLSALDIDDLDSFNLRSQQLIKVFSKNNDVELKMANGIWLNTDNAYGIRFNEEYKKNMLKFYSAEARDVTNSNAADKINSWCSKNTNNKIKKLIDDPDFLGCLTNAVYFKGSWQIPFKESGTKREVFTDRNGSKTETDFMNKTAGFRFYEDKKIKMLELPYSGSKIAMYAVLSDDSRMDIMPYIDKLSTTEVHVSLPKFKIEYNSQLNDILSELGAKRAFDRSNAQFGSMFENYTPETVFYISKVLHKTYIDVSEEGTEAAAVTGVMMQANGAVAEYKPPKEFIADRPFSFFIMDTESREILFMGEYAYVS